MKAEMRDRICALLREAVRLMDREQATLAAIHVCHALDALRCPVSERPDRPHS